MLKCLSCGLFLDINSDEYLDDECFYCGSTSVADSDIPKDNEIVIMDLMEDDGKISYKTKKRIYKIAYHQMRYHKFFNEGDKAQAKEEYYRKMLLVYRLLTKKSVVDEKE